MLRNYSRVIKSTVASPDAKYEISNIFLEYETVTHSTLASSIKAEYDEMVLLYDRILRHGQISANKSETTWNWSFNTPCKSLKGILVPFEEEGRMHETRASFTILRYRKSLSLWKVSLISYMLKE